MNSKERWIAMGVGLSAFVIHLSTAKGYGWFRDELYYVACGEHLAFGYVDHPPLVALSARAIRWFDHSSPVGLRAVAALVGSATVALTGRMASQFGAGTFGVAVAALCALVAPFFLSVNGFFSMNAFDLFFWALASSIAISILCEASTTRRWLALGIVVGIGLENKFSIAFFAAGFALGLLATPSRSLVRTREPWLAASVAFIIWLPNLIWNTRNGWMTLTFMNHARLNKNAVVTPGMFLYEQVMQMQPVTAVVWLVGLASLMLRRSCVRARPLAVVYLFTLVVFMIFRGKAYYVGPAYPVLFAAGAANLEPILRGVRSRLVTLGALIASGAVTAPLVLPILEPQVLVRYMNRFGFGRSAAERNGLAELPQRFSDQFGWDSLTKAVAHARDQLEPSERRGIGIFAQNYGEAGAIDILGPKFGLPQAMSAHNTYWLWGPKGSPNGPFLIIGGHVADHRAFCGIVTPLAHRSCRFCMPAEQELTIYSCREPKSSISEIWPRLKHFD
jgi:hypothetical protein